MNTQNKSGRSEAKSTSAKNQSTSLFNQNQSLHEKTTNTRQQFYINKDKSAGIVLFLDNKKSADKDLLSGKTLITGKTLLIGKSPITCKDPLSTKAKPFSVEKTTDKPLPPGKPQDDPYLDYEEAQVSLLVRPSLLHIILAVLHSLTYRVPKPVTKVRIYRDKNCYAVCPRCNSSIEYEYQLFCGCCGQHLEWSMLDEAEEEFIGWNGREDD